MDSWLELLGYLGAAATGAFLALLAVLFASIRRARQMRVEAPRSRIEVIRRIHESGDKRVADERARRVVEMWADQTSRLDAIDPRLLDYNRRMVEEVAAAYGREITEFRLSRAAKRVSQLLSDELGAPLAAFDRYMTVSSMVSAHRFFQRFRVLTDEHPGLVPSVKAANEVRRWAVRAYRVFNLAIPQLLFYEAATGAAIHYGWRYVQGEMRELTEKVGAAAMEIYGEAIVGHRERELIEASLLFDLLVRVGRIGGLTAEKDLLLKKYLRRTARDLESVEDLYVRFREELGGKADVESVVGLLDLPPEKEKEFFLALEELAAANSPGSRDRERAEELRKEIRERFERARAQAAERKASPEAIAMAPPSEPATFETIVLALIDEEAGGVEVAALAERAGMAHQDPVPDIEVFFANESHFFRALDAERFRVDPSEAQFLIPRLARVVAAVRLYSSDRRAHRDEVVRVFRAAAAADADADVGAMYEEMRRAVKEPETRSLWRRLARVVKGDPRTDLLPTQKILETARRR